MKPETYRRLVIMAVAAIPMDMDEETANWWARNHLTFKQVQRGSYAVQEADRIHASLMEKLNKSIHELNYGKYLNSQKWATFSHTGISYVGQIVQMTREELLKLDGFGKKHLEKTIEVLNELGLNLDMDVQGWVPPR